MWRAFRDAFVVAFREAFRRAQDERAARRACDEAIAALARVQTAKARLRKQGGLAAFGQGRAN